MRASSIAFAIALAIAMPCGAALLPVQLAPWVYPSLLGFGFGVGLAVMAALDFWDYARGRAVDLRMDEARAWASELANREREAQFVAPEIVVTLAPDPKVRAKSLAVETFFRAGDKAGGFSEGKLAGCVGSDHGPWLRHFYMSEAGGAWLRDAGGNIGTMWNFNRTLDDALMALRAGTMPLPPGPVPDVKPLPDSAAQRRAPQKSATRDKPSPAVIDGVSRAAE